MKKILAFFLAASLIFAVFIWKFNYESPKDVFSKIDGIAAGISKSHIADDKNLIGARKNYTDSFSGIYSAECNDETGRDIVFGGGSVKNRNLKIHGVIACRNGSAYICVKENNRVYKITADKNGKFETNLNFKSGGNYIMIYYENFSGKTELTCEYEKI